MADINITITAATPMEEMVLRGAIQKIAKNFNKVNLIYIAELSEKQNVNEKFEKLKNNKIVQTLL
jgi:hypothetical protein